MVRRKSLVVSIGVIGCLLAGCRGASNRPQGAVPRSVPVPSWRCSAAAIAAATPDERFLPAAVAETRREIVRAATACDYDRLEELASAAGPGFQATFGVPSPGRHSRIWRQREDGGDRVLATLVQVLALPVVEAGGTYVWPSVAGPNPTDPDWTAAERLYRRDELATMRRAGGAYGGARVGIAATGQWLFFVSGD